MSAELPQPANDDSQVATHSVLEASAAVPRWSAWRAQIVLALLTVACLLPFSGKAVHMDDPLFLWAAKQIVRHPLNPYGFTVTWYWVPMPMSNVTENPPLASYYAAAIGAIAGWSEQALHLGFLLPAIAATLGAYSLALRFTHKPFLAATATLFAPGFLVSATGLMCDVMMVALWLWAVVLWIKGLDEPAKPWLLALSGLLIAASALTKYFGVALIPLLLVYSLMRLRRLGSWLAYLAIPVVILGGYELWTRALYGHGLLWGALHYKPRIRQMEGRSGRALVGLAFAGGCTLPALTFVPLLWSRRQVLIGGIISLFLAIAFFRNWADFGTIYQYERWLHEHKLAITMQLFFHVAGTISILALVLADLRKRRDAVSVLLLLWVLGTLFFAIVINWTVNARSLLPLAPAVAILIARRLDERLLSPTMWQARALAIPLVVSGAVSLWASAGDMVLANTARNAANYIHEKTQGDASTVWFEGRWGFEYYMQAFGARPLDPEFHGCKFGDLIVLPKYNTSLQPVELKATAQQSIEFDVPTWMATMNPDAGAGFYFSGWGPLPFVLGPVPTQQYLMARAVQEKP